MRQAHLDELGAEILVDSDRLLDGALDVGVEALDEILPGQADLQPLDTVAQVGAIVGDGKIDTGRVEGVVPGDRLQHDGAVLDVAGHRTDLIEGGGEGDDAVAADPAIGRLEADDAAVRGRLADRAAGIGSQRGRGLAGGDAGGAGAGGSAGHGVEVPGVLHRPVGAVFVGAAHGELVHVQLADDHRAALLQPGHGGAVVGRHEALKDLRGAGGTDPLGAEDVLKRHGNAGQQVGLAGGAFLIRGLGGGQGLLFAYGDEGVDLLVGGGNALEAGLGQLDRGDLAGSQFLLHVMDGQFRQFHIVSLSRARAGLRRFSSSLIILDSSPPVTR